MGGDAKLVLYSYWRSSCSWRVRIALGVKGLDYETRAVNLVKGEQKSAEYLALNPGGVVPSLVFPGGLVLNDSVTIMEALDRRFPDAPPLFPKDEAAWVRARQITQLIAAAIQPIQNLRVLKYVSEELKGDKVAWAKHWITAGFVAVEGALAQGDGCCCVGDVVSAADACLVPQIYNARRFGVDMDAFPRIVKIGQYLETLPAFRAADASRQPDTPEAEKASD